MPAPSSDLADAAACSGRLQELEWWVIECKEPYSDTLKGYTPGEIVMGRQRPDAGL